MHYIVSLIKKISILYMSLEVGYLYRYFGTHVCWILELINFILSFFITKNSYQTAY